MSVIPYPSPLTQALVNDVPQSYVPDTVQPLSLTSDGRLRVSTIASDLTQAWQSTLDNPWASDNSPWREIGWFEL